MIIRSFPVALLLSALFAAGVQAADDVQGSPTAGIQEPAQSAEASPAASPAPTAVTQDQAAKAAAFLHGSGWGLGLGWSISDLGYVGYTRQGNHLPEFFYHYGRFYINDLAAGYLVAYGAHYRFTVTVDPQLSHVKASDSPRLAGIQTRERSINGNVNLNLLGDWGSVKTSVSHDLLDRNNGTEIDSGYSYSFHLGGWDLTPGIGLSWENANLTGYYYGVSPAEATPTRPAYSPGSAANPYISLGLSTRISEHWLFHTSLDYTRFGSAIHDSPIIDRSGSPTLYIGFTYNANPYFHKGRRQ